MPAIEHVFVLMLENRSFDHMLGFAGLQGADARTGEPTRAEGLTGSEWNALPSGERITVSPGADFILPVDPGHDFDDVLEQLCGAGATYPGPGGAYPPINMSGFASRLAAHIAKVRARVDASVAMRGFRPDQLPVLNALAREFAVCDHWFSSMPGPTWPNRLFVHAASSAGLDDSPNSLRSATAIIHGYEFEHGTIYDRLDKAKLPWHVVEGDALPQSLALGGMIERAVEGRFIGMEDLHERLRDPGFDDAYVFIEPSYGHVLADGRNFKCGNSQHPLDDVTRGERLLKDVYETIRSSPVWPSSLLVITYDEHGGFYDHVAPPPAVPPGDKFDPANCRHDFRFDQLGVRVPAVIVSPHVPRGVIDHTVYDHTSVLATVEQLYGLDPMTKRDAAAARFDHLFATTTPREDAPMRLPDPAVSGIRECEDETWEQRLAGDLEQMPEHLSGDVETALVGFLHVAAARQLHLAAAVQRDVSRTIEREEDRVLSEVSRVRTKFDAVKLLRDVEQRYARHREVTRRDS
jgi:phospholipase C